jgi:hypothetical protein
MTIDRNDIEEVLKQAEDTLYTAKLGLAHVLQKDAKARIAGLRNVIVFGRAVTNVLQRLRHLLPDFDAWYQPYVDQMEADPLMKFLYRLRSEILKEGSLHVHSSVRLSGDPTAILRQFRAPPRAKSFFVGDRIGGSGWEVEVEDGRTERYYVQLPDCIPGLDVDINIHFTDAPAGLRDFPAADLCQRYIEHLERMVGDARKRFSP